MPRERPPLKVIEGGAATAAPRVSVVPSLELIGLGTGLTLIAVLLGRLPSWRAELGTFQALLAVAFAFYGLAVLRARRYRRAPFAAPIVFAVAVAARVALLPVTPTLSDDVYRYVWEGRVVVAGENPYREAPLSPALAALRDREVFPRINHPELASVYPPLALAGFALVAGLSPTVWAMKLWVVLHDLALVLILLIWLGRRGENRVLALAYAWNPTVLAEFAGSGHHDPTGLVWLAAALAWAERRPLGSALALAAGTLVKLVPLAALPFLWRGWPRPVRWIAGLLLSAGLALYVAACLGDGSGLGAYVTRWRNNELIFALAASAMGDSRARALVVVLLFWLVVWLTWRRDDPAYSTRTALRAGLLLSPVAHPWYLAWPIAMEPLGPSAPWLLLSLTCVLSYGVLAPPQEGGDFHLPLAWRCVEYGLPAALALALAWRERRREDERPKPRHDHGRLSGRR